MNLIYCLTAAAVFIRSGRQKTTYHAGFRNSHIIKYYTHYKLNIGRSTLFSIISAMPRTPHWVALRNANDMIYAKFVKHNKIIQ